MNLKKSEKQSYNIQKTQKIYSLEACDHPFLHLPISWIHEMEEHRHGDRRSWSEQKEGSKKKKTEKSFRFFNETLLSRICKQWHWLIFWRETQLIPPDLS